MRERKPNSGRVRTTDAFVLRNDRYFLPNSLPGRAPALRGARHQEVAAAQLYAPHMLRRRPSR